MAICETKSNNFFVLTHTSFDQNNFYFLPAVQEAVDAFMVVLRNFGFFQKLAPYNSTKHPTQPNSSTHPQNSNLACCNNFVISFADFTHLSSTSPCKSIIIFFSDFTHLSLTSLCRLPPHFSPVHHELFQRFKLFQTELFSNQ